MREFGSAFRLSEAWWIEARQLVDGLVPAARRPKFKGPNLVRARGGWRSILVGLLGPLLAPRSGRGIEVEGIPVTGDRQPVARRKGQNWRRESRARRAAPQASITECCPERRASGDRQPVTGLPSTSIPSDRHRGSACPELPPPRHSQLYDRPHIFRLCPEVDDARPQREHPTDHRVRQVDLPVCLKLA